ncbi:hypothetical protein N9D68_02735 [Gammaproteobacteria bacterium]|nr:hypothetical protein [Gammaproteobacteria bacterium]
MKKILALFLLPQFISGEIFYLECEDYVGNQTEIVKIDTDKKKFIFDKDYLTDFKETELEIVAFRKPYDYKEKFTLNKLKGTLLHKKGYRTSDFSLFICNKTRPFIE